MTGARRGSHFRGSGTGTGSGGGGSGRGGGCGAARGQFGHSGRRFRSQPELKSPHGGVNARRDGQKRGEKAALGARRGGGSGGLRATWVPFNRTTPMRLVARFIEVRGRVASHHTARAAPRPGEQQHFNVKITALASLWSLSGFSLSASSAFQQRLRVKLSNSVVAK